MSCEQSVAPKHARCPDLGAEDGGQARGSDNSPARSGRARMAPAGGLAVWFSSPTSREAVNQLRRRKSRRTDVPETLCWCVAISDLLSLELVVPAGRGWLRPRELDRGWSASNSLADESSCAWRSFHSPARDVGRGDLAPGGRRDDRRQPSSACARTRLRPACRTPLRRSRACSLRTRLFHSTSRCP